MYKDVSRRVSVTGLSSPMRLGDEESECIDSDFFIYILKNFINVLKKFINILKNLINILKKTINDLWVFCRFRNGYSSLCNPQVGCHSNREKLTDSFAFSEHEFRKTPRQNRGETPRQRNRPSTARIGKTVTLLPRQKSAAF